MSEEEAFESRFSPGHRTGRAAERLDPRGSGGYSVIDLKERITALEAEIVRTRKVLDSKQSGRSAADALFSFKGS